MRRGSISALAPILAVTGALLLGGCGGGTKTVSVTGAPPATTASTSTTAAPRTHPRPSTTTSTVPSTTAGGAPAPSATRTATEPAFTHKPSTAEGLSAAEAVLQAQGYSAENTAEYHPNQTLRVLIGTRDGSQQAFFFVDERYIGTDAKQPSASIEVVSQSDTEVTLAYALTGTGGASAGKATVRFQLDNGQLTPLDPIPPASSRR